LFSICDAPPLRNRTIRRQYESNVQERTGRKQKQTHIVQHQHRVQQQRLFGTALVTE